jgi:hypothetical protein
MSKPNKPKPQFRLPQNALQRVNLGQAFAEYDNILKQKDGIFVRTPAISAALDATRSKCFFVGRRGTGKTAITLYVQRNVRKGILLQPQTFSAGGLPIDPEELRDVSQRQFRSLVACFRRALLDEVLQEWVSNDTVSFDDARSFALEKPVLQDSDFDLRMLTFVEKMFTELAKPVERDWLREIKKVDNLASDMESVHVKKNREIVLLIDRIDEAWDGSDTAVIFLMALMHACVQLSSHQTFIRPLLFVRENIFDRVRQIDKEYSRLETCVVSLNWTEELLVELVERRLQANLNPKPAIGDTWDYFFESIEGVSSRQYVFEYCQLRPRDILTYCSLAIETANGARRQKVAIEDLQEARKRFSESRLKDLGDEYSENYPQIQVVLHRFHGLGTEFTISGVESLIQKLIVDTDVRTMCGSWIFEFTAPSRFIQLLYGIGFWGIRKKNQDIQYRSVGTQASATPAIEQTTSVVIHPAYHHALDSPNRIISDLDTDLALQEEGLILDIPESIKLRDYYDVVDGLLTELDSIPHGHEGESRYEDLIGRMIELCFFRSLTNVEPQSRDVEGRIRRDWIASNRANDGFWERVRARHQATQVVWECKNFAELDSGAFHQMGYYLNDTIGRFGLVCFRGEEVTNTYYGHLKRLADKDGKYVALITERDVKVFLRQAKHGKVKESHIQEIYDRTIRKIS